ncbi:N-methyl-L-tryptophan oxidase [Labedella phragmitis]|uniref:N-methyl-L-tryptophan oxidase n=2 Tax=Labedella TaxID=390250 RepID=A0A444Q0N4_9MICO|nr:MULTISPECIES: N-methyl-L-tryptophan oxidase [Labedella]RWZ46054.1 N-methyl-L-tryptophan oxidase [Labedella phragmitis]RWZ54825.1 N-methyl-L-tryptophan oxidase [Labedella populi]
MNIPDYDVAVIGLGTMGSMALWRLSQRPGLSVIGVEQYGIGHPYGAFAGESRLFRTAYHEGASYVPMLLRARELWFELEERAGTPVLLPVGTLSIGRPDTAAMRNVLSSVTAHGLPHDVLTTAEARERYPQHALDDDDIAVLDHLGGALRPERAVLEAVGAAVATGAQVASGEEVVDVSPVSTDRVRVETSARSFTARRAIVTAGAWASRLDPEIAARTEVRSVLLTWFAPRASLDAFAAASFPTFIRDRGDVHFFGAPSVDGYTVKVSPGRILPAAAGADQLEWRPDPALLSTIGRNAAWFLPDLHPEPVRYSVHPDLYTETKVPIIDVTHDGRIVTATAFSGHGFKFAPIIGEMAAALALDGGHALYNPGFRAAAHPVLTGAGAR